MNRINWPLVILAYFSLFCLGIADNARSSIYPDILKALNLSYDKGSIIFSLSSFMGLLSTMTAKFWLPKFGIINPQRFFSLLLFIAAIVFGLSISYIPSYPLALVGSSLIGITMGGLSITMNLSIDEAVPAQDRRKFLSGLHSLYGLSSGFAPVILLFLTSWGKGFKQLYFVISAFPIILFLLSLKTKKLKEVPKEDAVASPEIEISKLSSTLLIGSILSFYVCSEVLLSSRFIVITNAIGLKNSNAGQSYLSSFFMLLTFGRIIFAFIKTKKTNFIILISSIVLSLILFAVAKITSKPIFLSIIGLSMSIYFPCAMDYIAENFKGKLKTHLPMIMNIVTIKLIFMHYLAGRIEESFGAQSTLYLSVFFLIMASLTLVYHRSEKNKKC